MLHVDLHDQPCPCFSLTLFRILLLMDLPDSTRFLCSATSAGAFLAIRFVSHAERLGTMITALVFVSPMLEVYTRALGYPYGQSILTDEEHKEWGVKMFLEGARLRHHGDVVLGQTPLDRMGIYPVTTVGCKSSLTKDLLLPDHSGMSYAVHIARRSISKKCSYSPGAIATFPGGKVHLLSRLML